MSTSVAAVTRARVSIAPPGWTSRSGSGRKSSRMAAIGAAHQIMYCGDKVLLARIIAPTMTIADSTAVRWENPFRRQASTPSRIVPARVRTMSSDDNVCQKPTPGPVISKALNRLMPTWNAPVSSARRRIIGIVDWTDSICRPRSDCHVSGEVVRCQPVSSSELRPSPNPTTRKETSRRMACLDLPSMGTMSNAGHSLRAAPQAIMAPHARGCRLCHRAARPMQTAGTMSKRNHMIGPRAGTKMDHHTAPHRFPLRHRAIAMMASRTSMTTTKS